MTLFWVIAVLLVAAALAFLLPPLLRARPVPGAASRTAANASIYREQLDELLAELQRGAVTREQYERACGEIERRIVAEQQNAVVPAQAGAQPLLVVAVAVGLLVPLLAGLGYWQFGNPGALRSDAEGSAHAMTRAQMESLVERLSARMAQTPEDAEGWVLLGRSLGVLGQYERSAQAYAKAAGLMPNDAGILADYADTLAMAQGRKLQGEPFAIVKRALAVDPEHLKALALAGSAAFEGRDYAAAIAYWERILRLAPPQSEFAQSVQASIAEARSLSGTAPASRPGAALQGIVSLDPAVASKVSPGDTVFVIARPLSQPTTGPRMPLAVARTTVAELPYRFTLDDSMAMAPGATISSHSRVVVAARISKSGGAAPQKGDLEGASTPVVPGASGVRVVISRIVD